MTAPTVQLYRWTREEFEQLASTGIFDPEEKLELLDGEIYQMTPQSSLHATAITLVEDILRDIYQRGYNVRVQMPLAVDALSLPEPDVAVVRGRLRDYRDAHPRTALLVVEVADSSLTHDMTRKRPRYAQAGIPEYWIVNLSDYCLDVYHNPAGDDYEQHAVYRADESFAPISHPNRSIAVADLLP